MKLRTLACLLFVSCTGVAHAQAANRQPTEADCLGLITALPTFDSREMRAYYEMNREATGKDLAEKLRSVADSGDKDAQFTLSMLLLRGYCFPQDLCAARRYREMSRGGANDWEKIYTIPTWLRKKESETRCN